MARTPMADGTAFEVIAQERHRLADELDTLADDDWQQPSLCEGWTNHVMGAHLNLPWSVAKPAFLLGVLKARGGIDRAMDRFSLDLAGRHPSSAWPSMLRTNAGHRFTPPGFGPEAPLTDVVVHGADILTPLGRRVDVSTEALRTVFAFLTSSRARSSMGTLDRAGLALEAEDIDVRIGSGDALVQGPALALCGALLRRRAHLDQLRGPGVEAMAARFGRPR